MSNHTDKAHILIVDDDPDVLITGRMLLKRSFERVTTLNNTSEALLNIRTDPPDVILLDMNFKPGDNSGSEGLSLLGDIKAEDPNAVVIMVTAYGDVQTAVTAIKHGAHDFITKPWQNEKLMATVSAGLSLRRSRMEASRQKGRVQALAADSEHTESPIIGSSPAIKEVLSIVEHVAPTQANVLILGENGTGKELIARALHRQSNRADEVFMSVDLGAIPETLFDSELFGHVKGAFTDARNDRIGRLEAASGGTLFLDEIGNLPLHLQSKLLTALEQRQIIPVGTNRPIDIDVRIIAATNRPAAELASPDIFRPDLLFRINTVEIKLPPLRDRSDDIAELTAYYLREFERRYNKPEKAVAPQAMQQLQAYTWPGNIRALRHAVERAVILNKSDVYIASDFSLPETNLAAASQIETSGEGPAHQQEATASLNLEELERITIAKALKKHRFNISHTAKELGLTRAALYRRMEKHGL